MDPEREFAEYVNGLAKTLGDADRVAPLGDYCRGLMLSGDRKSVEPMAALVAPRRAGAKPQSLHHFVAKAEWSDAQMLTAIREAVLPAPCSIDCCTTRSCCRSTARAIASVSTPSSSPNTSRRARYRGHRKCWSENPADRARRPPRSHPADPRTPGEFYFVENGET